MRQEATVEDRDAVAAASGFYGPASPAIGYGANSIETINQLVAAVWDRRRWAGTHPVESLNQGQSRSIKVNKG
jgi:hypothetical protein